MNPLYRLARPVLFRLDPETAHGLSVAALKRGLAPRLCIPADPRLRTRVAGVDFPNPLGLAAGYDKNAEVPDAALRLGFGFAEIGTVTPQPQAGNERPRVFRLAGAQAIVNRLGFNNEGHAPAFGRMRTRTGRPGVVGVNIGANRDSADRVADYVAGVELFQPVASYLTVNVSSPNTHGLRAFQTGSELDRLLRAVVAARDGVAATSAKKPVFLKVAPDLDLDGISEIAEASQRHGIDGLIVSNTTLSRRGVEGQPYADEGGGLSGRPLMTRSTWVLAAFRRALGPNFPLMGVGGVESAETMLMKIEAGADLVQLYTALVYGGPELPGHILKGVVQHLDKARVKRLADLRDSRVDEILRRGSPAG